VGRIKEGVRDNVNMYKNRIQGLISRAIFA